MNVMSSQKKCFTGMGQSNIEQQLTAVTSSTIAASQGTVITGRLETPSIIPLLTARLSLKHIQGTFAFIFKGSVQTCSICLGQALMVIRKRSKDKQRLDKGKESMTKVVQMI